MCLFPMLFLQHAAWSFCKTVGVHTTIALSIECRMPAWPWEHPIKHDRDILASVNALQSMSPGVDEQPACRPAFDLIRKLTAALWHGAECICPIRAFILICHSAPVFVCPSIPCDVSFRCWPKGARAEITIVSACGICSHNYV